MRTSIIIGLLVIADSINTMHAPQSKTILVAMVVAMSIYMDVIDFINSKRL